MLKYILYVFYIKFRKMNCMLEFNLVNIFLRVVFKLLFIIIFLFSENFKVVFYINNYRIRFFLFCVYVINFFKFICRILYLCLLIFFVLKCMEFDEENILLVENVFYEFYKNLNNFYFFLGFLKFC